MKVLIARNFCTHVMEQDTSIRIGQLPDASVFSITKYILCSVAKVYYTRSLSVQTNKPSCGNGGWGCIYGACYRVLYCFSTSPFNSNILSIYFQPTCPSLSGRFCSRPLLEIDKCASERASRNGTTTELEGLTVSWLHGQLTSTE